MGQNDLGSAYGAVPIGDRGESLVKAIACFEAALRVRTEQDLPLSWAETQENLGIAYSDLPSGNRDENLAKAIACFESAARGYEATGLSDRAERARQRASALKADSSS
jgi:hypothetical protein